MFGKRQNLPATCRFTFADGRHRRMRPHTPPSAVSASTMALSAPRASGQYNLLREIAPRANARRRLSPGLPPTGSGLQDGRIPFLRRKSGRCSTLGLLSVKRGATRGKNIAGLGHYLPPIALANPWCHNHQRPLYGPITGRNQFASSGV
jgi:hypothetical protein